MRRLQRALLPILVIVVALIVTALMMRSRPKVERLPMEPVTLLVRVITLEPESLSMDVVSQGTVRPRTESRLSAQVAGQIQSVSRDFVEGGFFAAGQVLVTIDPRDFELALAEARQQVAEAQLKLRQEEAEAEMALREWEADGEGEPTSLTLREPQIAEARAKLEAAKARERKAELDLKRARVRAPFAGVIREKLADVGEYVSPGTALATAYAVDYAEVRLPVPQDDLAHLDLAPSRGGSWKNLSVTLRSDYAGQSEEWPAEIVRTGAILDDQSRMLDLIARVKDPYGRSGRSEKPPLLVGTFVEATIQGRRLDEAIKIPRSALWKARKVLVVDGEDRLRFRDVEIERLLEGHAVIRSGLTAGERICISSVEAPVDGMKVRVEGAEPESEVREESP